MSNTEGIDTAYPNWKAKLAIELKGKALEEFNYIWDGVSISPFEERKGIANKSFPRIRPGWLIGAGCELTNESILHALQFGAEIISLNTSISNKNLSTYFKDIRLDWITLVVASNERNSIDNLFAYLSKQKYKSTVGAIIVPDKNQCELYSAFAPDFPNYKFLSIDCSASDAAAAIADKFNTLIENINRIADANTLPSVLGKIWIRFTPGADFVLNISMIRALRQIWVHVLSSFNVDTSIPIPIYAYVKNYSHLPADNMILSTAVAVACIAGGCDALFIDPPDLSKQNKAWHIKLQHIMKEEALFDKADDPVSGAFLIERLSTIIAEKIWQSIN